MVLMELNLLISIYENDFYIIWNMNFLLICWLISLTLVNVMTGVGTQYTDFIQVEGTFLISFIE